MKSEPASGCYFVSLGFKSETGESYYCSMLVFLDYLLSFVHLAIVGFNLFGWIPRKTRKAHLISVVLTAASWFILGIWYGMGYCPVTDWQWDVKEKLGETGLPASFIKYFADKLTGSDISPEVVNYATLVGFILAVVATVYVNFFRKSSEAVSPAAQRGVSKHRK